MTIAEARRRLGWSIARLAVEADVPEHVIRHAERGGTPREESALKIADCLDLDVIDLWPIGAEEDAA